MYYIRGNTDDIEDSLKKDRLCEIENTIQIFESEVWKKNIVKTRSLKNIKIVKEAKDYHWYNEVQIFLKTCQTINAANYSEDVEPLKLKLNYIIENNPSAFDELYNFFYRRADKKMAPIMNLVWLLEYLVKELTMFDVIDFAKVAEKWSRETITTKKELIVNIKANLEDYDFSEKKYKKEIWGILWKIGHKNLIRYEAILTFCKLCIFRFKIASMRELYSVVLQIPLK